MEIMRVEDAEIFQGTPLEIVQELQRQSGFYGPPEEQPEAGIFPYAYHIIDELDDIRKQDSRFTVTRAMFEVAVAALGGDQEKCSARLLAALQEYELFELVTTGDV